MFCLCSLCVCICVCVYAPILFVIWKPLLAFYLDSNFLAFTGEALPHPGFASVALMNYFYSLPVAHLQIPSPSNSHVRAASAPPCHLSGWPPSLSFIPVPPLCSLIRCFGTTSVDSKDKQWWIFLTTQMSMISPSLFTDWFFFFFFWVDSSFSPHGRCRPSYLTLHSVNRDVAPFCAVSWHGVDSGYTSLTVTFAAVCDVGKQTLQYTSLSSIVASLTLFPVVGDRLVLVLFQRISLLLCWKDGL